MHPALRRLGELAPPAGEAAWGLEEAAGRLVELCGEAVLTAAFILVLEVQGRGEPVGWVSAPGSVFFPPDAARSGVDLEALVVVRVPDLARALRAADRLVRSGGFGLVVVDLVSMEGERPVDSALARLASLARKHAAAVLLLTDRKPAAGALGPLVALRAEARRRGRVLEVRVLKGRPGKARREACRVPDGLC